MATSLRFRDQQGFMWHAVEVRASAHESARGALYFFSGGSTRCLRDYDDNWAEGLWSDLDDMKDRALPLSVDVTRTPADSQT